MDELICAVCQRLDAGHIVEFSWNGKNYFIQQENNKGWDYVSIWRESDPPACLARALFDIFDGISPDTVRELLAQPCVEGRAVLELAQAEKEEKHGISICGAAGRAADFGIHPGAGGL